MRTSRTGRRALAWCFCCALIANLNGCDLWGSDAADGASNAATHTVGGTVVGLASGVTLTLLDNNADPRNIAANGTFNFTAALAGNAGYAVTISSQPPGQTCTVAGGVGTIGTANVANVVVTCSDQAFMLGGTIQGLNGSGLVLANGGNALAVPPGAKSFTLPTPVAYSSSYSLGVKTQPAGLACAVSSGSGTMPAHDITSVSVTCTDQPFTLGGTITGLGADAGLTLDNGTDTLDVAANTTRFTMPKRVPFDSPYTLTVRAVPPGLVCTVSQGTGTMPASNVTNVAVACADQAYTVGGSLTGLTASGLVLKNGGDTLTVPANAASFTMPTPVPYTGSYAVMVQTQPTNLNCTVNAGSGTMGTDPVTDIAVVCAPSTYTVGGSLSGITSSGLTLANGADSLAVMANAASFTMPLGVANGAQYNVTVQANPLAETCSVTNGSGIIAEADITNIAVSCSPDSDSILYSFSGAPGDGAEPWYGSLLLANDGNFYGTTYLGGIYNGGTVFKITPAGVETVLWSFGNGNDGSAPYGSLIQASDGNFYGTTNLGGLYQHGTVFKITPAGVETVLWSFGNANDGDNPFGSLIQGSDGNFYGMTYQGGRNGGGTVFKITPAGVETTLWSFGSGSDGSLPYGTLVLGSDGNFYGMNYQGGAHGEGTIFMITPAGSETVLWSFGGSGDGAHPGGTLILGSDGNFYGMTIEGGANGAGTVFKFTRDGDETVLHSFGSQGDGIDPTGALIQGTDGNFYGMTCDGGLAGWGTIFEITPSGTETVLYSFGAGPNGTGIDGQSPFGDLTLGLDGTFYGMTSRGGAHELGAVITLKIQ